MGEDHRPGRGIQHVHGGAIAGMGAIDQHADAVHLLDDAAPEGGEARILVMAAAAGAIGPVVGEEHLAHAEAIEEGDHVGFAVQRLHPLDIEGDGELPRLLGRQDVVGVADQREAVGMLLEPGEEGADVLDRMLPVDDVIADIDREVIHPRGAPMLQDLEIDRGIGPEARVIVPDQRILMQPAGGLGDLPAGGGDIGHVFAPCMRWPSLGQALLGVQHLPTPGHS